MSCRERHESGSDARGACRILVALLAAAAMWPAAERPAAAQTAEGEVDEATREEARALFRQGRELYQGNRPEQALELLGRSYDLLPSWATSNGMALCEDKLEHPEAALALYERSLREGGDAIGADQRTQLEQRIGELRRSLGLAWLRVVTVPDGAEVELDGRTLGTTPFAGDVTAGTHSLRLTLDGYESAERSLSVGMGESRTLDVTLVAAAEIGPGPVVGPRGRLALAADGEGWTVTVDGASIGATPLPPTELDAGEHLVRVEGDDRVWEERIDVPADRTVTVSLTLGSGVHQGWFWGVAATAAAAGIGWAATGGYAWSLHDEWEGETGPDKADLASQGELMQDVADSLLGVAAGAALTALILGFFTDFGGEAEADVSIEGIGLGGSDATATSGLLRW